MCWNFVVYRSKISDVSELKTRLIDEWAQFDQSMPLSASGVVVQTLLSVCVGHTLNTNSDSFETNL